MLSPLLWVPVWEAQLSTCGVRGRPPTCAQVRPPAPRLTRRHPPLLLHAIHFRRPAKLPSFPIR